MTGETNLKKLLLSIEPKLNEGEFVFCTVESFQRANALDPLCVFQEQEAVTVVLPKEQADEASLRYSGTFAWITLTVHSALEAVGLTAAVSKALTKVNISCNVIAAYYHDHIFVPITDAERAMEVLENLSKQEMP